MAFLRKLAIAAVRLLHNPLDQVICVAAILLVNIAATAQYDPYEEQYLDYMELVALSCNLMILFSGYLFYSDLLSSRETQVAGVLIVILMAGSIVAMILWVVWDISPIIRQGVQLYLPTMYIQVPVIKLNPKFKTKASWIPFHVEFVQIRLGIYHKAQLAKLNSKDGEAEKQEHSRKVRKSQIEEAREMARAKLDAQNQKVYDGIASFPIGHETRGDHSSTMEVRRRSSFLEVDMTATRLAMLRAARAFIMDPKTAKALQHGRATLNRKAYQRLKQWLTTDQEIRDRADGHDEMPRALVQLSLELLYEALPSTFKEEVSKDNADVLLRSIRNFVRGKHGGDRRDGRRISKAETEPARFRRKSNSNEQRAPLVGGVIKSSQAEQVWSYVCFEMGDVWIVQPGAHIQLPKGNYGVTLIGLPTGTVIQPPKHCEFATEDMPRKKAFVVRKADRRRSWRIQQGATLRIPADLLEPFLIGLPVGTTVVDDETAIRGRVGEEDLDIVHDLSKHDGLFSGNKSRCVEGLDSASRRKRLLAYFDRIHAEIELRQVGSQYTSTFLEWRRHGSSLLRRQSSSSGGAGGGTEAVDKSAMLARIAARARMLSALVFSGMLSLIGFTTTMDS